MQTEGGVGEAVRKYQAALAKDPHHSPAALALGTLLAQPGTHQQPSLAEVCPAPASCLELACWAGSQELQGPGASQKCILILHCKVVFDRSHSPL